MFGRHAEVSEYNGDDENVVHRERKLDEIAGEEFQGFLLAPQWPERKGEDDGQRKPDGGPEQGFLEADHVGAAMEQAEIERKEDHHARNETDPMPDGDLDQRKH